MGKVSNVNNKTKTSKKEKGHEAKENYQKKKKIIIGVLSHWYYYFKKQGGILKKKTKNKNTEDLEIKNSIAKIKKISGGLEIYRWGNVLENRAKNRKGWELKEKMQLKDWWNQVQSIN